MQSNQQSTIKYLPHGKNVVKIGPLDPEFILLKGLLNKRRN